MWRASNSALSWRGLHSTSGFLRKQSHLQATSIWNTGDVWHHWQVGEIVPAHTDKPAATSGRQKVRLLHDRAISELNKLMRELGSNQRSNEAGKERDLSFHRPIYAVTITAITAPIPPIALIRKLIITLSPVSLLRAEVAPRVCRQYPTLVVKHRRPRPAAKEERNQLNHSIPIIPSQY